MAEKELVEPANALLKFSVFPCPSITNPPTMIAAIIANLAIVKKIWTALLNFTLKQFTAVINTKKI